MNLSDLHEKNLVDLEDYSYLWSKWCTLAEVSTEEDYKNRSVQFAQLMEHYTGSTRKYHNHKHLIDLLKKSDGSFIQTAAIFFHDVIYVPGSMVNEFNSSSNMRRVLKLIAPEKYKDEPTLNSISSMIMATRFHQKTGVYYIDEFLDLDMSILASPWEKFLEYDKNICEEYSHFASSGRKKFLLSLLDKEIFHCEKNKHLNKIAKENINRIIGMKYSTKEELEISRLKKKLSESKKKEQGYKRKYESYELLFKELMGKVDPKTVIHLREELAQERLTNRLLKQQLLGIKVL